MRVHRITLKQFRGVEEHTVEFAPRGVTVLVGPNEVGKSSITEGLDILLRLFHDSRRAEITSVKPVDADAGPEVEAELSLGEYRFTYSKRWLKNPVTKLTISAPRPEQLTGRDAHNRVQQLLDAHLDRPLFDALRFVQGSTVGQHAISQSTSLMAALDRATNARSSEPDAGADLVGAIESEYARYFTPGGRDKIERSQMTDRLVAASADLESAEQSLQGLEQRGAEFIATAERIGKAEDRLEQCRIEHLEVDRALVELDAAERDFADAASTRRLAESELAGAERDQGARVTLIAAEQNSSSDLDRLIAKHDALAETLASAETSVMELAEQVDELEQAIARAEDAERAATIELQRRDARVTVGLLRRRIDELSRAEDSRVNATRVLDANSALTPKTRSVLDQALTGVAQADAARTAAQPEVTFEPKTAVVISIDGVSEELEGGTVKRWNVEESSTVQIGEIATVTVASHTDTEIAVAVADAHTNLAKVVRKYGLKPEDPRGDLEQRLEAVAAAKQDLRYADERRNNALFDLTSEQLRAKFENAVATVADFAAGDDSLDVDSARNVLAEAAASTAAARSALAEPYATRRVLDEQAAGQRIELSQMFGERTQAQQAFERAKQVLEEARGIRDDETLAAIVEACRKELDDAQGKEVTMRARRDAIAPDTVRAAAENLDARERRTRGELETDRMRREQLTGELRALGAQDLQADLDQAHVNVDVFTREHEAFERRARAAQLLYDTFSRHRETARANRAKPYADEVNRLARFVFGPTAIISVSPSDFSIESRTMNGTTVSFAQLSTGAREQLAVIAVLACAILVNPDGPVGDAGAPVILDDVLGFTDPVRLRRLGPVFAEAAKSAQVILLTASPERYESIGDATVVHLSESVR